MIQATDLRPGTYIKMDGVIYEVTQYQHVKPGKGGAFVRTKIRNVKNGNVIDKTFSSSSEKVENIEIEENKLQFSYKSGINYVFMDMKSYEQFEFTPEQLGDNIKFLKEEMEIYMMMYEGEILGIKLPFKVDLKVVEAPPGIKGDSAGSVTKPVTLETGAVINAPLFINAGEMIKVDTRTGEYIERSK